MLTKKIKTLDIKVKRNVDSLFLGNYKTFFKWRWLEFSDFREYEAWDDVKNIDWVRSASEWKTFIKLYKEERDLSLIFLLDLSESMKFWLKDSSKADLIEELFFILSYSWVKNWDKIGLILQNWNSFSYLKAKKWKENMFLLASKIEETLQNNQNNFSIDEALLFINNLKLKHNLVFILTDKFDFDEKKLKLANLKNQIMFFHIFDDFENTLLGTNWLVHFVWDSGENITINLSDTKKVAEYRAYRENKSKNFSASLAKLNIKYLSLDNKKNIFKELFLMFSRY